jgi:eukaryotic-like serine/threonine-protein kinase
MGEREGGVPGQVADPASAKATEVAAAPLDQRSPMALAPRAFEPTAPYVMPDDAGPGIGAHIGRYVVQRMVGTGGMGLVVAAQDPELGRLVAIKVVAGDHNQAHTRLVREARAMARVSHPNVVTVHEVIRLEDRAAIVMELVDGQDLATWRAAGPRGWREIVAAYVQAARGLAAAHRAGLVHRDFKPTNALIDRDGVVRVTDFGLVRAAGSTDSSSSVDLPPAPGLDLTLTRTGAMIGTPAYMAPEQHAGEPTDARTDQWSLACSLYTALYEQRPFPGEAYSELSAAVLAGALRPEPSDTRVPRPIRAAIRRALSRRPADRFASIDDLIAALSPGRRATLIAAALGATAIAGAVAVALIASGDDGPSCTGLDAPLVAAWNQPRAGELRTRLVSVGGSTPEAADRVVGGLDRYAAEWTAARTRACTLARQGVGSAELLDRRMRCLDQRLVAMSALVGGLAQADRAVLRGAGPAADRLHPIAECTDPRDPVPRPAGAQARAQIAAAEAALARGWALQSLGYFERALPLARQAAETGERTGWSPLLARALILRGDCEDRQGMYKAALATYESAATVAARSQDDALIADALARRFLVLGEHLGRPAEALEGRRYIELALERAGRPQHLRAMWLHFLAIMLHSTQRQDEALEAEVEAVSIWRQIVPAGHVNLVDALETQGNIEIARGQYDRAEDLLQEVLAAKIAARGSQHLSLADTYTNLGVLEVMRGRWRLAIDNWERSVSVSRAAGGASCIATLDIGLVRYEVGQWRAAIEVAREAQRCMEVHRPGESTWVGVASAHVGRVLLALGELDRAGELLPRAIDVLRSAGSPEVAASLADAARLALLRGDRAAARARLDEAVKADKTGGPAVALARAEFARAESGCAAARPAYERAIEAARQDSTSTRSAARCALAECMLAGGKPSEALAAIEPELAWLDEVGADPAAAARARFAAARALVASRGDRHRARSLAVAARDGFASLGAPGRKRSDDVARWLTREGW